jgi:hypothetical protein
VRYLVDTFEDSKEICSDILIQRRNQFTNTRENKSLIFYSDMKVG